MTKEFLEDIRSLMVDSLEEKKKLDPVGKADADIDNDGDVDDSDEYLHKRRKAIGKAMKDEGNEFTGALAKARANNEKTFTCAGKEYEVKEVEEYEKDLKKKDIKEGKVLNDIRSFLEESIGTVRIPDAGQDSSGIRKAVGKDGGSDGGMSNKEKVGYNALKAIAQKIYRAMDAEQNANSNEEEERAKDAVIKYRAEFQSKAKFYKDATAAKAKADAKKG